jgi:hypothetical protein
LGSYVLLAIVRAVSTSKSRRTSAITAASSFSTSTSSRFLFAAEACFLTLVGRVRPVIPAPLMIFNSLSASRRQFEKVKAIAAQEIFWWVPGPCTPATWIRRGGPSRAEHLTFIHASTGNLTLTHEEEKMADIEAELNAAGKELDKVRHPH